MIRYADRITVAGVCLAMLALAGHALLVKHDKPPQEEQWGSHERGPVATGTVRGDRPAPPVASAVTPAETQVNAQPESAPLRAMPNASTVQRAPERRSEAPRKLAKVHAAPRMKEETIVQKPADVPLVQAPVAPEPEPVPVPVVSAPPPAQVPAPVAMVKPEPVAETPAPAKTRAQVMEELNAARMSGALPRFGNPDPYGPGGAPSTSTE